MDTLTIVLIICALLLVLAVTTGVAIFFWQRYNHPEPSLLQRRLMTFKERQEKEESTRVDETLRTLARFYKDEPYQNPQLGQALEKYAFFLQLKKMIVQADIKVPVDQYLLFKLVMPTGIGILLSLPMGNPIGLLVGLGVSGMFYMKLVLNRANRFKRFTTQLPDALNLICTSLRAGHSFQAAIQIVSTEMPDPLAREFALVVKDTNLGIPVKDALERLAVNMENLPDIRMFVTAVLIQREAGGNLAEILDKLSYTIRERFKLKGQIAALTGQSRLTGYVLGAAPAVLLTGLSLFMYTYVAPLYETQLGNGLLALVVLFQLIGFVVMKKIVDIRV